MKTDDKGEERGLLCLSLQHEHPFRFFTLSHGIEFLHETQVPAQFHWQRFHSYIEAGEGGGFGR